MLYRFRGAKNASASSLTKRGRAGIINAEGRCYGRLAHNQSTLNKLTAWVPAERSTSFWGGEEQNHNDNAQTHHETKDKLPNIVSHQQPSPPFKSRVGVITVGQPPYVTAHTSAPPVRRAHSSYRMRRVLSNPAACEGGVFCGQATGPATKSVVVT